MEKFNFLTHFQALAYGLCRLMAAATGIPGNAGKTGGSYRIKTPNYPLSGIIKWLHLRVASNNMANTVRRA
ncbi:MAG: hypothetical protein Fur0021_30480 [Candidatus Promineifilaceae bacterium]